MRPPALCVIVEPDDGLAPVREFIDSADTSLLIKQFTFTERSLLDAVIARTRAGIDVRVMLNPRRSGGDRPNDHTYEELSSAGVAARWSNPKFAVTHEKSMVADGRAALVSTFNLCEKYFTLTRDYGLITENPHHVAQIVEVFDADWEHRDWAGSAHESLLWSDTNSRDRMAQFIDSAKSRLDIQHPKYVDAVILERLVAAVDRGVKVNVLCGGKRGISDWDIPDTFASLRTLCRLGVKVRKQKHLRVHAKLILADRERALVGSMNIDRSAFDLRRELGVVIDDSAAVKPLKQTFDEDWKLSRSYHAPDPLVDHD